jgi:hypothetical protein
LLPAVALVWGGVGCLSLPPEPPLDLSDWTIRNGQAVWKPAGQASEIAGELLVASHPNGSFMVQFSKSPLPFVSAQQTPAGWQAQFFAQSKSYAGRGRPPARIVWLQLPLALSGNTAAAGWSLRREPDDRWRFEQSRTGETLEGFLTTTKLPSTYQVRGGDTLPGVARWQGVGEESLREANPGPLEKWFKPGHIIRLPKLTAP